MNRFYNPVRTVQGAGSLRQLPDFIQQIAPKGTILLLVWNEQAKQNETIQNLLAQWGDRVTVACFPHSNPNMEQLFHTYKTTKERDISLVIAIGGGSTLDVGKALCCLYGQNIGSEDALRLIIAGKKYNAPACPWIGVPTTAGTGSEVTCWATVWDPKNGVKYSIDTPENYAYAALDDPELLYTMPLQLAISSALDAAAHAAESYWAKASNTVTKALALQGIRLVMGQIDALLENPADKTAHDFMSQGSLLAGLAFSNTRTTACHSISYPLTMRYSLPHGVAVSLLFAPVMKLNWNVIPQLPALLEAFGVHSAQELWERISQILDRAGFATSLKDWGVCEADIPELAAHSITKGRADNNPADLNEEVVAGILKCLL